MAKKTAVKRSKRRLKRTARRSMAVVLMITAIVVAAIPVPENMAENSTPDILADSQSSYAYVPATKSEYETNGGKHNVDHQAGEKDCWEVDVSPEGSESVELPDVLKTALGADRLRATARTNYRDGNSLYLEWEFLYHPSNTRATLCKYNSEQNRSRVVVSEILRTDYQVITLEQYDAYFSDEPATKYTDKDKNPMNNLNPDHALYPANQIVYGPDNQDLSDSVRKFFEKYREKEYADKKAEIEKWENREINEKPDPLVVTPNKDLSEEDRKRFYCEHNMVLNRLGVDFTLVRAADKRLDENGKEKNSVSVFVAQSTSKDVDLGEGYVTDENGCLAIKDPDALLGAIGERAFAGVTNVDEIIIPKTINTIGDFAFEGAGMRSVELNNDAAIGNGTFRNCTRLTSVKFGETSGTYSIGAEAFYGCSNLTQIVFPDSIRTIGYGAFANCELLATVDFSKVTGLGGSDGCALKDFAFYDDKALTNDGLKFEGSNITSLGKACFALASMGRNEALTNFKFPGKITGNDSKTLGEYALANREKLTEVTMPENYQGTVPSTTFYNCIGLHNVIFPDSCGAASFKPDLFAHVTDQEFFVRGPELFNGDTARPRSSTWEAATRVSGEAGVPYVYTKDGKDCYEVAMKSGDNIYRYEIDSEGTLNSCVLVRRGEDDVDIVIPKKVGNYDVKSIGKGCFDDEELRRLIRSITIQNDSIAKIDDEAFTGLQKLKKVRIGNSVSEIGERAFADCTRLVDVYFNTPKAGYGSENFKMANSAFQTGGRELTFHGDIVKGYAPFEYAMTPSNVLRDPENSNEPPVNVCYQSLWNSEADGTHLTVMVDRRNNDVVLLDYPKLTDLSQSGILRDEELKDYCRDMESYYYNKVYDVDSNSVNSKGKTVGELRREYARLLDAARKGLSVVDLGGQTVEVSSEQFEKRYGPWINERFCEQDEEDNYNWVNWLDTSSSVTSDVSKTESSLYNFLFEPMVVEAATVSAQNWTDWLTPYFEKHPYNFMENYQLMQDNPSGIGIDDYQMVGSAKKFIDGTETIIVPEGVTSIDVTSYADSKVNAENSYNYDRYIGMGGTGVTYIRDTNGAGNSVPGLFSGRFVDYRDENGATKKDPHEEDPRGNDVVKRVELRSVKRLPDYAFDDCEQLKTVSLGAVSEIGLLPFRGCGNMTELIGNESYPVEKGILFAKQSGENAGKYRIIECLMSKGRVGTNDEGLEEKSVDVTRISLLKDVNEIAKNAFEGCENILLADFTDVDGLKEIPEGCFKDCTSLSDVILPTSVNKVKEGAFEGVTQSDGKHIVDVTIRGREVDIADDAFSPKNGVIIRSYLDSAAARYADRYNPPIEFRELGSYRVKFFDYDGTQIGKTQELERKDGEKLYAREPDEAKELYNAEHRKGYKFTGEWLAYDSTNKPLTLKDEITEDLTTFIAQYESDGTMVGGQFVVEFYDGVDGQLLPGGNMGSGKYYIDAGMSFAELNLPAPVHPQHAGYEPLGYSENWTVNTVIDKNMSIIALYRAVATSSGTTSGGTTSSGTTSGNSGNNNNNSSRNSSSNNSSSSSSSSSSSTSSSSTSATSTTSGAGQYTVFVEGGSGSGSYTPGTTVIISASVPAEGMRFDKWATDSNGVSLASVSMTSTTFTMPSNNVTVKANFVEAPAAPAVAVNTNGGTGNNTATGGNGNGNTQVDIEKPGISNRDLATANTNGSSDNFVVKISETDEATRAVAAALTNKYGTLDNILYYAMDISLYDSTGTTKITDTTGLSVDITIPIPDSLVAYGGNNMAGAVVSGDQLESLNENFTTINGVPCIRFRAEHFSPYTIYVDTGNLVEGMLDVTPKTGDPIHPKWFLSLGLACLSIILFMKRDKKAAVKA